MAVILASQTTTATSERIIVDDSLVLIATVGIAADEDTVIQVKTETDGWTPSGEILSVDSPSARITGPVSIRLVKPVSAIAYAVEVIDNNSRDL